MPNIPSCIDWDQNGTTIGGDSNRTSGQGLSSLNHPTGIFIDVHDNNTLYIADQGNKRILKLQQGEPNPEVMVDTGLNTPYGIFVDRKKNVYVGDSGKVLKFDSSGKLQGVVAGHASESGSGLNQLGSRLDEVIVDDNEQAIYISDYHNQRVVMWKGNSTTGVLIAGESNRAGTDSLHLHSPGGMFIDSIHNALYVVDIGNHRVQRFQPIGNKTGQTVAGGNGAGASLSQLDTPTSVVIDQNENIYVSDYWNHRIAKWSASNYTAGGVCIVGCSSTVGEHTWQMNYIFILRFDSSGNLIVNDFNNHRIRTFTVTQKDCA